MADERANIFFRAYNVRSRVQQPMFGERHNALLLLSKPPQRRFSGAAAHDFGSLHRKRKAPEVSPRRCVRDRSRMAEISSSVHDSPTATPDFHYLIIAEGELLCPPTSLPRWTFLPYPIVYVTDKFMLAWPDGLYIC